MPEASWERVAVRGNGATAAAGRPNEVGAAARSGGQGPWAPTPGAARHPQPPKAGIVRAAVLSARRASVGVVVVDPLPLFRAGAVAALGAGGVRVLGEAAHLVDGVPLARTSHAEAVLLGGASVDEVKQAVAALPSCAVVVLLAQPSRTELVDMLGAGVAGLALRSLTADELVGTVEAAAEVIGTPGAPEAAAPAFVPFPVAPAPPETSAPGGAGPEATFLTPKEREILSQLAQGASNKRIAEALFVTPATVKSHLAHIYAKLGARGRNEALTRALSMGLLR